LGGAALLPVGVTLALLLAFTLIALLVGHRDFGETPHFVAALWLALNQAPLAADGVVLGMLPLLPTLLYGAAVAWQVRTSSAPYAKAAADSIGEARPGLPTEEMQSADRQAMLTTAIMVTVPVLVTALATTVLDTADIDFPARADSIGSAILWTAIINLASVIAGLWWAHVGWLRRRIPPYIVAGVHMGVAFVAATWAITGIALCISLIAGWSDLGMLFGAADGDAWGRIAVLLLSIGYLPNLFGLGSAAVIGGQAHIGDASVSVFSVNPGDLPALPVLAAWPSAHPNWAWQVALVLAALSAVLVARLSARWFATTRDGVLACVVAAATAIAVFLCSEFLAGGEVGLLGNAGYPLGIVALYAAAWMGLLGAATMALSLVGVARKRSAAAERIERRRERVAARNARFGNPAHDGGAPRRTAAAASTAAAGAAAAASVGAGAGESEDEDEDKGSVGVDPGDNTAGDTTVDNSAAIGEGMGADADTTTAAGGEYAEDAEDTEDAAPAADASGDHEHADGDMSAPDSPGLHGGTGFEDTAENPVVREVPNSGTPHPASPQPASRNSEAQVAADDPDTDEIPLITEAMLAEAEAADGWGEAGGDVPVENDDETLAADPGAADASATAETERRD